MIFVYSLLFLLSSFFITLQCPAQAYTTLDLNKPQEYEQDQLPSEKSTRKKFTSIRKLYHNTTTHYNYYFYANQRMQELLEESKLVFKDDYSQLLPFYNYTLKITSEHKRDWDSIIYRCNAAILLHDLRSSWVDNMYLIMGRSYYYKNDLDMALQTFQYLNYAFAPKESGGYDVPIGSNLSNETGEYSVSTKEKEGAMSYLFELPPSRNDALLWQIRTQIMRGEMQEAGSLLQTFEADPAFPTRLKDELFQLKALWYYSEKEYSKAADYLIKALPTAANRNERVRWEYLIAQLYELANLPVQAYEYYDRTIVHATDPLLVTYARIYSMNLLGTDAKGLTAQQQANALIALAKKEKNQAFRDIIYYMAARIEAGIPNWPAAEKLAKKSIESNTDNKKQRNLSYLLLADVFYSERKFDMAQVNYKNVNSFFLTNPTDAERTSGRIAALQTIVPNFKTVQMEDSLQRLAKMNVVERTHFFNNIKKQKTKSKPAQLKTDFTDYLGVAVSGNDTNNGGYFANTTAKNKGYELFKSKWGNRPNIDKWRRITETEKITAPKTQITSKTPHTEALKNNTEPATLANTTAIENAHNWPTTPDQLKISNKKIAEALFAMAQTFQNSLEDYTMAIEYYEELLRRYPENQLKNETLFNLSYCYTKIGKKYDARYYKELLRTNDKSSKYLDMLNNKPLQKTKNEATPKYETIYNLFLSGQFQKAVHEKRIADSMYKKNIWGPQLLYIEAVYYIKTKQDSLAMKTLYDIVQTSTDQRFTTKAARMIEVLKNRKNVEAYLSNLSVTRKKEDEPTVFYADPVAPSATYTKKDTANQPIHQKDTATPWTNVAPQTATAPQPQNLSTEDPETAIGKRDTVQLLKLGDKKMIQIEIPKLLSSSLGGLFGKKNKLSDAPPTHDSTLEEETTRTPLHPSVPADTTTVLPADTIPITKENRPPLPQNNLLAKSSNLTITTTDTQAVIVILKGLDNVYLNEATNAFRRFNKTQTTSQPLIIDRIDLSNTYVFLKMSWFFNLNDARSYAHLLKQQAPLSIVPWLGSSQYVFIVINKNSLPNLTTLSKLEEYIALLKNTFPDQF